MQNQQKHTLQQKNVVAGKNLPYELIVNLKSLSDLLSYIVRWSYGQDPPSKFGRKYEIFDLYPVNSDMVDLLLTITLSQGTSII